MSEPRKKLIEVSLPLEVINREAAREKSIRHGHPSTLHLWWARRPLAAARAVLFAQLVDDPSSRPDEFPTEAEQKAERERLHRLIEKLVVWENTSDEALLAQAHAEIVKSCDGNPPPILDPFAGGGTIPLEAQRLGLEAHASDLNPVAVLINKALIEIPPKFRNEPPVFPGVADERMTWRGAEGLAADVRAYGEWMRDEAEQRIGHMYPKATLEDGTQAAVIAWIWARTVTCPNPTCGIEMPLVHSWWLGKKKGKEAYIVPDVVSDPTHSSGQRVSYSIGHNPSGPTTEGTVERNGATCVACNSGVPLEYVRSTSREVGLGAKLMAVVAEGNRRRIYIAAAENQVAAASSVLRPEDVPPGELFDWPGRINVYRYGLTEFADLFTNRQLVALTTFADLVNEARERVLADALAVGLQPGDRLNNGGIGPEAYADAVATYLAFVIDKCADYWSSLCSWHVTGEKLRNTFGRQAIPMVWDFAETAPFSTMTGGFVAMLDWTRKALANAPASRPGFATQSEAQSPSPAAAVISTDPPYYDNIGYSDLSDFFYVWLRRAIPAIYPDLLSTMLVPKSDELVANPYRHGGKSEAKHFFEEGFRHVFAQARTTAFDEFPITVYYAFKQTDTDEDGQSSSGWETLLDGMIRSGWAITATWPMRSELSNRILSQGTNALASSIVLALRPRRTDASSTDRRGLIAALHAELPEALRALQLGTISPVDLPQAAIGPGMAVFSRYSSVIEDDGSPMSVRSALARINEILDQVLNEQEGDFDATTRFCLAWYRQHGYSTGQFGQADDLARARNTAVDAMDRGGVLTSRAGKVTLLTATDLPTDYNVVTDEHISVWETLHHAIRVLESEGVPAAGAFLAASSSRTDGGVELDLVKELAFLLFSVAEKNKWTKDALSFNSIATSWPDIIEASRNQIAATESQSVFDYMTEED